MLLGRALRDELLLLERDFAGGFKADGAGAGGSSAYAGEIKALAGATIPAGWLVCDGSAINRIDFSALFAAIGSTWGAGDGSTTYNIPDLRGRTAIGAGKGATGGSVTGSDVTAAQVEPRPDHADVEGAADPGKYSNEGRRKSEWRSAQDAAAARGGTGVWDAADRRQES